MLLFSSDTRLTLMLLFLVYKHRPERTGFNMYVENTQQQLTFLTLLPWLLWTEKSNMTCRSTLCTGISRIVLPCTPCTLVVFFINIVFFKGTVHIISNDPPLIENAMSEPVCGHWWMRYHYSIPTEHWLFSIVVSPCKGLADLLENDKNCQNLLSLSIK